MDFVAVLSRLIPYVLELLAWVAALAVAIIALARQKGRPQLLFLIGVSLIVFNLVVVVATVFVISAVKGASPGVVNSVVPALSILSLLIYLAGVICLTLGFWNAFKSRSPEHDPIGDD